MKPSPGGFYLDTCLLISLFHNDSGYAAAEAWLVAKPAAELWISHWVLLEFASATAVRCCRGELSLARSWLEGDASLGLRAADALHLALAHRSGTTLISADQALVRAGRGMGLKTALVSPCRDAWCGRVRFAPPSSGLHAAVEDPGRNTALLDGADGLPPP